MDTFSMDRRLLLLAIGLSLLFFFLFFLASSEALVVGSGSGAYGSIPEAVQAAALRNTVLFSGDI